VKKITINSRKKRPGTPFYRDKAITLLLMEKNCSCMEKKMGAREIDSRIATFIRRHHVMTLATCGEGGDARGGSEEAADAKNGTTSACEAQAEGRGEAHVLRSLLRPGGAVWCANIFYAWMPAENIFVFTTDRHTRHGAQMERNPNVAASIVLETKVVGLVRGLQMLGVAERVVEGAAKRPEGALLEGADEAARPDKARITGTRKAYLRRFPYAALADLELWTLRPTYLKMTDNLLGFGKKLIWEYDGKS